MEKKREFLIPIYVIFAIVCAILAFFYQGTFSLSIYNLPYEIASKIVLAIGNETALRNSFSWIVYFLFSLAPLTFPIIYFCKNKKLNITSILFIAFTIINAFVLFVFINPSQFGVSAFETSEYADVLSEHIKLNAAFIGYTFLLIILATAMYKKLKNHDSNAFPNVKGMIYVLIGIIIFNLFCFGLKGMKDSIASAADSRGTQRYPLFISYIHVMCILEFIPGIFNLIVWPKILNFVSSVENDMYDSLNEAKIKDITKWIYIYILATLCSVLVRNLVSLLSYKVLMSLNSTFNIDIVSIIFMFLFGYILVIFRRSSAIKEENDLTI